MIYQESRGNQTMKFDQLVKYNVRYIFPQKLCRNTESKAERPVPDLFLFFIR